MHRMDDAYLDTCWRERDLMFLGVFQRTSTQRMADIKAACLLLALADGEHVLEDTAIDARLCALGCAPLCLTEKYILEPVIRRCVALYADMLATRTP